MMSQSVLNLYQHDKLIDSCIKNFLNKRLTEKPVTLTAEKKDLVIVLPFLVKSSLDLRTCLKNSIRKNLPFCRIRVVFKSCVRYIFAGLFFKSNREHL